MEVLKLLVDRLALEHNKRIFRLVLHPILLMLLNVKHGKCKHQIQVFFV